MDNNYLNTQQPITYSPFNAMYDLASSNHLLAGENNNLRSSLYNQQLRSFQLEGDINNLIQKLDRINQAGADAKTECLISNQQGMFLYICKNDSYIASPPFAYCNIHTVELIHFDTSTDNTYNLLLHVSHIKSKSEDIMILLQEKDLEPKKVIAILRANGIPFVSKRSDQVKGQLLLDYFSGQLQANRKCRVLPSIPGWNFASDTLQYIHSGNALKELFSSANSRHLLLQDANNGSKKAITNYIEQGEIITDTASSIFITLFPIYAIVRPFLEQMGIHWRKYLLIQTFDTTIKSEDITHFFFQIFNRNYHEILPISISEKEIVKCLRDRNDDTLIIKGNTQEATTTAQKSNLKKWQLLMDTCVEKAPLSSDEAAPRLALVVSNNGFAENIPLDDAFILNISSKMIDEELYYDYALKPHILSSFIQELLVFIEQNNGTILELLQNSIKDRISLSKSALGEINPTCITFLVVYDLLNYLCHYHHINLDTYWGDSDQVDESMIDFISNCNDANDCSCLSELFVQGINNLIKMNFFRLVNRKTGEILVRSKKDIIVYYDEEYLYFRHKDIVNNIMPLLTENKICAQHFYKALEKDAILIADCKTIKSYGRNIFISEICDNEKITRRARMITVKQEGFRQIGSPTILEEAKAYEKN